MTPTGTFIASQLIGGYAIGDSLSIGPDGKLWFEHEDGTIGSFSMTTDTQADYYIAGFDSALDILPPTSPIAGPDVARSLACF